MKPAGSIVPDDWPEVLWGYMVYSLPFPMCTVRTAGRQELIWSWDLDLELIWSCGLAEWPTD